MVFMFLSVCSGEGFLSLRNEDILFLTQLRILSGFRVLERVSGERFLSVHSQNVFHFLNF